MPRNIPQTGIAGAEGQPPMKQNNKNSAQQSERTPSENKERAFIAASRRSDRSLEARVISAKAASEEHYKRTGKKLHITETIVQNEEMYEEIDELPPRRYHTFGQVELPPRFQSYAVVHSALEEPESQASFNQRERDISNAFDMMMSKYNSASINPAAATPLPRAMGNPVPAQQQQQQQASPFQAQPMQSPTLSNVSNGSNWGLSNRPNVPNHYGNETVSRPQSAVTTTFPPAVHSNHPAEPSPALSNASMGSSHTGLTPPAGQVFMPQTFASTYSAQPSPALSTASMASPGYSFHNPFAQAIHPTHSAQPSPALSTASAATSTREFPFTDNSNFMTSPVKTDFSEPSVPLSPSSDWNRSYSVSENLTFGVMPSQGPHGQRRSYVEFCGMGPQDSMPIEGPAVKRRQSSIQTRQVLGSPLGPRLRRAVQQHFNNDSSIKQPNAVLEDAKSGNSDMMRNRRIVRDRVRPAEANINELEAGAALAGEEDVVAGDVLPLAAQEDASAALPVANPAEHDQTTTNSSNNTDVMGSVAADDFASFAMSSNEDQLYDWSTFDQAASYADQGGGEDLNFNLDELLNWPASQEGQSV